MKLSDIFKQQKIASGETAIPEQFDTGRSFDRTRCSCDLSSQDVSDISDTFNRMIPDSKPNCVYCGHSAVEHQGSGCGHGSIAGVASRVPLETTYLPHDGELGSARVLASALQTSGLSDSHPDHRLIISSIGNLENTHPAGEARRQFHDSVFNTIGRLMTTGRLPSDSSTGSSKGLFNERAANVKLLQDMAEHHGGDIMNMFDIYRKYSGTTLDELGIKPDEVSDVYRSSQERANQAARGILTENTQWMPTMTPDECDVCSRNASTLNRLFQAHLIASERQHQLGPVEGAKQALSQWDNLSSGHALGKRLPENSSGYLLKAQTTLDSWRDSGHLYGDAHSRNVSMLSGAQLSLEGPELGSGERRSAWLDRNYRTEVDGARTDRAFVPRNKKDETLSSLWNYLVGSHTGTEEDWVSTPGNFKKVTDLEDHLRSNGMGHVADRFIKREPLLEADLTGAHSPGCQGCTSDKQNTQRYNQFKAKNPDSIIQPPRPVSSNLHTPMLVDSGRQRISIDTGGHVITFIAGRRTLEGEQYTFGKFSKELPKDSVKLTTYGEADPYYSDLERYILKRGAGVDLDALTKTRVDPKKTLSCRGKRVEHTDESNGQTYYADSAVIPSLVPEEIEADKYPKIQEHECDLHDGHLFDSDGNITHVLMKNSRSLTPKHKRGMASLFEQALDNIISSDPSKYSGSREDIITNLGAEMNSGNTTESGVSGRPRFSPGSDLLGTSAEQQAAEESSAGKRKNNPKKPTRKK